MFKFLCNISCGQSPCHKAPLDLELGGTVKAIDYILGWFCKSKISSI